MDVLDIDGKNYVKSSVLARELGYTSDYIGQLCRGGKVDAKLFGRTWYVDRSSVLGHKTTRYRSSKKVTQKNLKAHLQGLGEEAVAIHTHPFRSEASLGTHSKRQQHAYNPHKAAYLKQVSVGYTSDDAELIPKPSRSIPITLADAQKVAIAPSKETFSFATPTLPEVRFRGRLTVSTYEEEGQDGIKPDNDHGGVLQNQKNTKKEDVHFINKTLKNKAISSHTTHARAQTHVAVQGFEEAVYPVHVTTESPVFYGAGFFLWSMLCILFGLLVLSLPSVIGHEISSQAGELQHTLFFDIYTLEFVLSYLRNSLYFFI